MLLGIDGGGSKTNAWLTDTHGRLLGRMTGPGTNINDIGAETAKERLQALLTALLAEHDGLRTTIESLYAGLAGCMSDENAAFVSTMLQKLLPGAKRIRVRSDVFNALFSLEGVRDGITVIAGTGSGAFVRMGKMIRRVGGWGYLIDDAGSGYDIGRRVLLAVLRAWDGREGPTQLTEKVIEKLNGRLPWESIAAIYQAGRSHIASFAPLAFEAAEAGDKTAQLILLHAEDALGVLIETAARYLRMEEPPYFVVLCGGLWRAKRLLENVQKRLGPGYDMHLPILPPVAGCVAAAADRCGLSGKEIIRTLRETAREVDERTE